MPDGRFRARLTLPDGSRKQMYAKTAEAAADLLVEAQIALRDGLLVTSSRRPLGDWLDQWLADYVKPKADAKDSPRTYEAYETAVRVRLKPLLGAVRLDELTASHIQRAYATLATKYAPKTTNFTHTVLAQALGKAATLDLIVPNPMLKVEVPERPDPNADDKAIMPTDVPLVEQVMANLSQRHAPAWRFLVDTGLRWGEASALRWSDVNLDAAAPYVSVRRANTRVTGGLRSKAPKSKKGRRDVPLTQEAVAALKVQKKRCSALELAAEVWTDNNLVFPGDQGQPLRNNRVLETFKAAQKAAGLTRLYTLHQLRHTYATRHFASGTHPKIVQDLLGHERIDYTLGIYTSSIPEAAFDAVRSLPPLGARRSGS
jgi:integrase